MMSSEPGSSSSPDRSPNIPPALQFSPPSCTMCSKTDESKSYCTTCHHYLCQRCDFAHQVMVSFESHHVLSLKDVQSVEDLEKILHDAKLKEDPPMKFDLRAEIGPALELQFAEGMKYVKAMMKLLCEVTKSLDFLGNHRVEAVAQINNVHKEFQESLAQLKDQIVLTVEEKYGFAHRGYAMRKEECEVGINNILLRLGKIQRFVYRNGENTSGFDLTKLGTNGFRFQPPVLAPGLRDQFPGTHNSVAALNPNAEVQLFDEAAAVNVNHDLVPYEPFNTPAIASEPRNLKCHVNPDLSLSTNVPDSPPFVTNHVNSMQIHKTFGQKGNGPGQLNSPHGFCLGFDEDIVVADSSNHRIQIFDKTGCFKFFFGEAGRHDGFLWHPRKVAVLPFQRRYIVCDRGYERSRMQIFSEDGKFIKKVYIQYIDIVAGIAVTQNEDIVVIDSVTPTVFIIGQDDFLRTIDCTRFMDEPSDITVVGRELYICDFKAHSVVVIDQEGNLLRKFGSKRTTMFPNGIDVSLTGDILIGDSHGNFFHVVLYSKDGIFTAEFRCPFIKVSRCCGLKLTNEGRLVTVDKNYHHVIILENLCMK